MNHLILTSCGLVVDVISEGTYERWIVNLLSVVLVICCYDYGYGFKSLPWRYHKETSGSLREKMEWT